MVGGGEELVELARVYVRARLDMHEIVDSSATTMGGALARFAHEVGQAGNISNDRIECWLAERGRTIAQGTLRSEYSAVRTFCRWLVLHGHLAADPTIGIRGPKQPTYDPRALEPNEVARLLRACQTPREELFVVLMVQLGLRCAEVSRIAMSDVDHRAGVIFIVGKGGKTRFIPLVEDARLSLIEYLNSTPLPHGPLFPSQRDRQRSISAKWLSQLLGQIFYRAGIKKTAYDGKTGHALRHTCLSDLVDEGADIRSVQQLAGHAHLSSTQIYMRRRDAEQLRPMMEGRNYRRRPAA